MIKIICPEGTITGTDTREIYSKTDQTTKEKKFYDHIDGVKKSYVINNMSIAIVGNANIGEDQIKERLPTFLATLDKNIQFLELIEKLKGLYINIENIPSTKYYISYYGPITQGTKYTIHFDKEPFLFCLDTDDMKCNRINIDAEGFSYGVYWAGASDKVLDFLKDKRNTINANQMSIISSTKLMIIMFQGVISIFKQTNEFQTVGGHIDLTIQTPNSTKMEKLYI